MQGSALIAMSGGVDSTVAAMLTLNDGLDCVGSAMKLSRSIPAGADDAEANARAAAEHLGIPFCVFDFSDRFDEMVIKKFIRSYRDGRTPNPCIDCNRHLKYGLFLDKAREMGKDCIVTGHYARIERGADGRCLLKKGADNSKDQSYVLYSLSQEQLSFIRLPLGGLSKPEVRELALGAGFGNALKGESQDICFVPDGNYADFIEEYTGEQPRKGRFIDFDGNDLGENGGILRYTIGQRRGLGLAMPYPPYVLEIRPQDDTVVVGKNDMLYSRSLYARDINLIPFDRLDKPIRARAKIRYNQKEQPATVTQIDEDALHIVFDEPQRAITMGQAAVIYDGDIVIGGGTIVPNDVC